MTCPCGGYATSSRSHLCQAALRSKAGEPATYAKSFGILVVALLALLVAAVPVAAEPNDGTVTGQVVNKTAGGASTAGTNVTLVSFGRKEQAPIGQRSTQTDADGRFAFDGLDRDPNLVYLALARYQNVNYPTDQPFQLQDQPIYRSDIGVYEVTNADDAIQLERLNLLVVGANQGLVQFMQMGSLVNSGDRTFVTANPQDQALARAIKFPLPSGALGVQMQTGFDDQDLIPGVGGVQVISPVPPGRHEFALSFQLPYTGSNADVSIQMPYPTASYSVYLPDTGLKLDARSLSPGGPTQLGGKSYSLYRATNLPKATLVGGQLSGLGSSGAVGTDQLALISLSVVLFVLGGGVLLFGGLRRPSAAGSRRPSVDPEQERLELVVRLAALDERFAAGDIDQAEYDAVRDRGKQRLRELMRARRVAAV
jgi:hypothetical protein